MQLSKIPSPEEDSFSRPHNSSAWPGGGLALASRRTLGSSADRSALPNGVSATECSKLAKSGRLVSALEPLAALWRAEQREARAGRSGMDVAPLKLVSPEKYAFRNGPLRRLDLDPSRHADKGRPEKPLSLTLFP